MLPLNCTDPFMLEWKDPIKLCSFGGQPIFQSILKRPSLLTRKVENLGEVNECDKQGHLLLSALLLELSEGEDHVHRRPFCSEAIL